MDLEIPDRNSFTALPDDEVAKTCSILMPNLAKAPVGFRIDTLCVSVTQPLRNKAITLMRETIEEADAVLVLDSLLLATSINEGFIICMLKTICCKSLRRLWTYQEGRFKQGVALSIT